MAHLTISMQVNHITKTQYSPFKSRLMIYQLISVFFIYLMHFFGLHSFTKEFYSDAIIVLFVEQVIF